MTPARAYALALVGLLLGGLVVIWSFGQAWGTVLVPVPGTTGTAPLAVSGQSIWPAGAVSGWVALASAVGVIATRAWGRQAIGVVAVLAGLVSVIGAVRFAIGSADAVAAATAATGVAPDVASTANWWILAGLAGLLVVAAGAAVTLRGRQWPVMGSRYERGPRRLSAWEAQDLGQDPTDDLVE